MRKLTEDIVLVPESFDILVRLPGKTSWTVFVRVMKSNSMPGGRILSKSERSPTLVSNEAKASLSAVFLVSLAYSWFRS